MTTTDLVIALARPDQFESIRAVELAAEALFPADDLPASLRGFPRSAAQLEDALDQELLWVALDPGGGVIGYAMASWLGPGLHLDEIDVYPAHQRRGVGRALVAAVRARAEQDRVARVSLTTFRFVPWNMPWYERLGFRPLDEREMPPELRTLFEAEIARGLPRARRVAMVLPLR